MPKRRSLRIAQKAKRREEKTKGQDVEEREVKRPRVDDYEGSSEQSICTLDINPFLVEPILRKLLKKVDTVAQLKDLRKMCLLWDNVNIEELEERAFKGKLKAIDFKWTDRFKTKNEAVKEFLEFLEDTRSIPRLFNSFKFNVTESLKVIQAHTPFFKDYTIFRVDLITPLTYEIKELIAAIKYLLSLIGANLKELQMPQIKIRDSNPISFEPKISNWPNPEQKLLLPKLEKLFIGIRRWDQLVDFFKSALTGSGSVTGHITSLTLPSLPGADIGSFPSLDPARMTRLDIGEEFKGTSIALKFTTGLMTLVEMGMRLKEMGLRFGLGGDTPTSFAQNLPSICSNMTHFFATQSATLTTLNLRLEFRCSWPASEDEIGSEIATYGMIQLPVFQALHTLSLDHFLQINQNMVFSLFEAKRSLTLHFPSLVNLTFDCECSVALFFYQYGQMGLARDSRFHFKRLEILHNCTLDNRTSKSRKKWKMLYEALIGSVDYLNIPSGFFVQAKIPWADSLRRLRIEYVKEPLKLAHLKNFKELTIVENQRRIGYEKILLDGGSLDVEGPAVSVQESVFDYLSLFNEVIGLSLTYIKFIGLKMEETEEEGIKKDFNKYFKFPLQFEK